MPGKLFGLVLAGGKSRRMGQDKGLIVWHGKKQIDYLAEMLSAYCQETYISCRQDQARGLESLGHKVIVDDFASSSGPYGALITAMKKYSTTAWLVVACDLPFFDGRAVEELIKNRDSAAIATAFRSPTDGLPEPLAAIWEPKSLDVLVDLLKTYDISCPRKALIKSSTAVKLIDPKFPSAVTNVNTPNDLAQARQRIGTKA